MKRLRTWVPSLLSWLAALSVLGSGGPLGAQAAGAPALSDFPPLFYSAAFVPAQDGLVVTDLRNGSLRLFDLALQKIAELKRPGEGALEWTRPAWITPEGDGFWVVDGGFHLLSLDRSLKPREGWWLPNPLGVEASREIRAKEGPASQLLITQLVPAKDHLVVVADAEVGGRWREGVWTLGRSTPHRLEPILEWSSKDDPYYVYQLNLIPGLAAVGERLFLLRGGRRMVVEQLLPSRRSLALPLPYAVELPPLSHLGGQDRYQQLRLRLAALPLARALHSWRGSLFLLGSRPGRPRAWELWRWDESAGWRGPLPLKVDPRTQEMVVVPGERQWAFFLKGGLLADGGEEVVGVSFLGAREIEEALR